MAQPRMAGFSLLEMLVVLVIAGILVSLVGIAYRSDGRQQFSEQAERMAVLFDEASDQALLDGSPLRWQASSQGYRFERRQDGHWTPIMDGLLGPRQWSPTGMRALPLHAPASAAGTLYFAAEMPSFPDGILLRYGPRELQVITDGTGSFHVTQR